MHVAVRHHQKEDNLDLLPRQGQRVLLLNPPIYDTRLHWVRWQQPALLLKLATYCRGIGADSKLLDMVCHHAGERLRRERVAQLDIDGLTVNKWRFGLTRFALLNQLREWDKAGWQPDVVYVECFTTIWWEGAAEAIQCVRQRFPHACIVLLGAYAALAPEHAAEQVQPDHLLTKTWPALASLPADLSYYPHPPNFSYVSLGEGTRTIDAVIAEVADKATRLKVTQFAFSDHAIVHRFPDLYRSFLEGIASKALKVNFFALGNIAPADLVAHPDLAGLMRQAGYKQIYFADDRSLPQDSATEDQLVEDYRLAAALCFQAGFPARTAALSAGLCLGRPGENLAARARLATLVAHHMGSVILWPYQPFPYECPDVSSEEQNGKLFPFRKQNGYGYRDYLDVMGLTVVLNAKHRTRTFDFLGEGLIPRLFRSSLSRQAWDPDPEVKGSLRLPVLERS